MRVIGTVVLATDLGNASSAATEEAIDIAIGLQARLVIVNVVDLNRGLPLTGRGYIRPVEEREARTIATRSVVQRARAAGANATFLIWDGEVAESVVAAADAEGAGIIVVGTRGRVGVGRSILGSVSDDVIRRAHCPVMVVRRGLRESGTSGDRGPAPVDDP